MAVYMEERELKGIRMDQLAAAQKAAIVREVNQSAQIPFTRIVEALDLTPSR